MANWLSCSPGSLIEPLHDPAYFWPGFLASSLRISIYLRPESPFAGGEEGDGLPRLVSSHICSPSDFSSLSSSLRSFEDLQWVSWVSTSRSVSDFGERGIESFALAQGKE
jgi:hypothetical protein